MREVHIIYGDLQHICINRLYVCKILSRLREKFRGTARFMKNKTNELCKEF